MGPTKPNALPSDDSQLATGQNAGWRKFTNTSGVIYDGHTVDTMINGTGDENGYAYLIFPNNLGITVKSSDGNNGLNDDLWVLDTNDEYAPDTITIPNYIIYSSTEGHPFDEFALIISWPE